ncbi:hypothetical protein GH714_008498 [Hevea brasiliensis]|uniref:Uncharacterized protein n=1 Tax=Hevea brasiliensis TaxID=3981 RepID=A0A6A6KJE4_HEVBR|nr:hypothetical protein GH714_008498 [Hevea brasiliensis]
MHPLISPITTTLLENQWLFKLLESFGCLSFNGFTVAFCHGDVASIVGLSTVPVQRGKENTVTGSDLRKLPNQGEGSTLEHRDTREISVQCWNASLDGIHTLDAILNRKALNSDVAMLVWDGVGLRAWQCRFNLTVRERRSHVHRSCIHGHHRMVRFGFEDLWLVDGRWVTESDELFSLAIGLLRMMGSSREDSTKVRDVGDGFFSRRQ